MGISRRLRKGIGTLLSVAMLFTLAFSNIALASDASGGRKIDVWDFGGIPESGSLYNNQITPELLDSKPALKSGAFATTVFGDLTLANPDAKDRLYYYKADGTTLGVNSYGTWGNQKISYADGYNSNGVYYANGSGGNGRRYLTLDNVVAGDKITVYGGTSNANETVHLVHAAVSLNGTAVTVTPSSTEPQDSTAAFTTTAQKAELVAHYSGSYQIYFSAGASGKPWVHRVMRTPGVKVSGTVNANGSNIAAGHIINFTNQTTGETTDARVKADLTFDALLATGYSYIATIQDVTDYRFSDETKLISTSLSDMGSGKLVSLDVVANQLVTVSGQLKGFKASYDISKMQLQWMPPEESLASPVTASVDLAALTYTADVQDGVPYTAILSGVNDYEVVSGGSITLSADTVSDITVAPKAVYAATGTFLGLTSAAQVTSIAFTNVDDGYTYAGTVAGGGYQATLRDGSYSVSAANTENYSTSTHVVVNGQNTAKDILFVNKTAPEALPWVPDLYVGDSSKEHHFGTVKEALAAAARMNPADETHRITIHIAPGVYRAQLVVDTPYITLVNAHPNPTSDPETQVKITWYYGIGYKYYSIGANGFYDEEKAFDKYTKNTASKWGGTVHLTSKASYFKAQNIIFENSFNKYMTDEELLDGVELAAAESGSTINVERKSFTDVTSKAATERAAAMLIEGNYAEFLNCSFLGSQDTLYTGGSGTNSSYFKDSFIEGNTDYIFGDGNVVFDNATLNFAGYSNQAVGGYITAAKDLAGYGYLFRNATVTADSKNMQSAGYLGRPWGAKAKVTFLNTKLESSSIITPSGWYDMSGNKPETANYAEYNTTYNGAAVDTSQRRGPVITDAQASAIQVGAYFGGWVPSYYTADSSAAPVFKMQPFFTTDDDINIPYTGNTISLGYEYEQPSDSLNDSALIQWYRVSPDGTETLIRATTAYISKTYKITGADAGHYIKAVVTPETVNGLKGIPASIQLDNLVQVGSSGGGNEIPDGQRVNIYVAGDSTVKTYGPTSDTAGWGEYLQSFFDSEKINIVNYANGGRSSRSFINEGSLAKIASTIKTGDYLLIQFGHNDSANQQGYLAERFVSMGQPDANGIYPSTAGVKETTPGSLAGQYGESYYPYTTGTFKWYLQQYIDVAKQAGATPILATPISRQYFNPDGTIRTHHDATDTTTGTVTTSNNAYVRAVEQLGEEQGVQVIDMFTLTKDSYEKAYKQDPAASASASPFAKAIMAAGDSTHNNKIGGFYNGGVLAKAIKERGYNISNYVIPPVRVGGVDSKNSVQFEVDAQRKIRVYAPDAGGVYTTQLNPYWTAETQGLIDRLFTGTEQPSITSIIQPADLTAVQGGTVALPPTVTAIYSNGTQGNVKVAWEPVNTAAAGTVEVHGTIAGYAAGVTVKVTIQAKPPAGTSTIWIVGDSTVSAFADNYYYPRYGWGTQLGQYLDGAFTIQNLALSGRSSKSFTVEPQYQQLLNGMKSRDYLLVGFGHNDEKAEAERYTNPNGTYLDSGSFANSLYEHYIKPAQAAGVQVILTTPIARRSATGVWSNADLHITAASGAYAGGDYPQAIRNLGTELHIPVVDMTASTKALYDQLGAAETLYLHAWTSSKPASVDNTHTNIWGGKYNAYLVSKGIKELSVSGLAEHVLEANAPTKASTLAPNPNYTEPPYSNELPQSALWADHGIWKGTVFGDVGGAPGTANQTLETDRDGNMHIAVANNKGKISGTTDGVAMYYYKVPANSTFTLTAKAKINSFGLNDQVSFGLMARDEMYIDSYINTGMGDYVAAAPLKLTKAAAGGYWNSFARKSGILTQGSTAVNPIAAGDSVDLRLEGNADGYAAKFGNEAAVTGGFDFKLTAIDPDHVYVGMFVARNADITFTDIKLLVDGKEVTTGGGENPTPTPETTDPADPNSTQDSKVRQYALEGYAAARGVTGGGLLLETSNRYWKVASAEEFLKAVAEAKSSGKQSVIELTADIALGSKEIGAALTQYGSIIKPASNQPLLHPTLIQSGVSTLQLSGMSNLTIFSKNGAKLTHVTIDIRNSSNMILRNLVFDELWEWDEATHGDYDRNDWDYITIQDGSTGIWIDHSTFYKAYDGIVDVKKAVSTDTSDVTISWSTFLPASQGSFFNDMMELLEANPGQYPFYQELLTTHAMNKEQIRQYSAAQKKTHLIGASDTEANTSNLRITLANNYYKNSMDRMPRVRQGSAHVYNTIMDATELYDLRNSLTDEYASSKVVSNGAISTQGASVLVENSSINGIVKALLSGNGSSPGGYIGALNSVYYMNGIETELTVTDSTYSGLVMDVDGFKNALPYSYQVYDARSLDTQVLPYAGAGAVSMSSVQWQKAVYNNLSGEDVQGPVWLPGSLTASQVTPTGLTLTWPAATDKDGVTGYKVYTVTGCTYSEHVSLGNVTMYNVTGLTQDTEYTFAVKAVDAAGNLSADALYVIVRTGREIRNDPDPAGTPVGTPAGNGTQTGEGLDSAVKEESKDAVVTAVIDAARITGLLAKMDTDEDVFTVNIKTKGDVIQTKLSTDVLAALLSKNSEAILQIKSGIGSYSLPVNLIDTAAFAKQWGVSEKDLQVSVRIGKVQGAMAESANDAAAKLGATVLSAPVEFFVSIGASDGRTQEIHSFGMYVARSFTLSKSVNPLTATGVMYNPQTQTFTPVPTVFNGMEAKILRPGNSIYTVLENPKTFTDLAGHWAKAEIETLASKLIVNGMSASQYAPDQFITRAEFAALLVRALGLDEVEASGFTDVAGTDWFSGAVGAAQKARLIDGFEDGSFRPNATISREQMAAMIVRAMSLGGKEIQADVQVLEKFADRSSISGWSKDAAAQALTAGIIQGITDSTFAPQENATRAQAAVMLKRTLQALNFIN